VLLEWGLGAEDGWAPEGRLQEGVGFGEACGKGTHVVRHGLGLTLGTGVAIGDTGEGKELLASGGSHKTSTTGGRDKAHTYGTGGSGKLHGHGVGLTTVTAPETTTDGNNVELGVLHGTSNGACNFSVGLPAEADVSIAVTDSNVRLERVR